MKQTPFRKRATARDLLYFAHPKLWPHWPFLPLTRQAPEAKEPELGVLYDARGISGLNGFSATVFLVNLLLLPATEAEFLDLPKQVYDTFEELADDGWGVD
jgi:hypothetical protein